MEENKPIQKPEGTTAPKVEPKLPPKRPAPSRSDSTAKTLKIIIAILTLVIVGMVFWFYKATSQKEEQIAMVTNEKEVIQRDLENLRETYSVLKTDNDTLSSQLMLERQKVEMLLEKVKKTERANKAQLKKYEDELGTLRAIMQGYIRQIDSLNTLNQTLIAENREVREAAEQSERKVNELTEKTQNLSTKVEQGSILKARDVVGVGLTSKDKENSRARRVSKLKVSFSLIENSLAETGPRSIYLRIKGPDGITLAQSENNLFSYQDTQLVYSAVREVDYQGEDLDVVIFYNSEAEGALEKGIYELNLYSSGALIGTGKLELK